MSPARRLLWPAALVFAVGCSRPTPPAQAQAGFTLPRPAPGKTVAHAGEQTVTAEEVQAALASLRPEQRARYLTGDARKELVSGMTRFRLLAAEAVKEGLAQDPEVIAAAERLMVHKLLARVGEASQPTDAEISAYYDAHKDELARPATVRLGSILLRSPQAKAKAAKLEKQVRALPADDTQTFAKLARENTEDPRGRAFGGDLRYATEPMLARMLGPEAATAGFALKSPGDVVRVDSPRGVLLLRLLNRTEPFTPTLEQAKPQIVARLGMEKREQALAAFVAKLEKDTPVTVDDAALEAVKVDAKAAPVPLGHPFPDTFQLPKRPGGAR
jgi:parvulin-like peptidyl-prolyl isomerase